MTELLRPWSFSTQRRFQRGDIVRSIAVGIFCKTPAPGQSKTRLSPPLRADECAAISACFIRDLTATIAEVAQDAASTGYAVYTPLGSEVALRALLPGGFRLLAQCDGDFGTRLATATRGLLENHDGAILVNSDSPTLPAAILSAAVSATRRSSGVVLSPALDGGYTLIGVSKLHARLYEDVPWSTSAVFDKTVERAGEIGIPVVTLPGWYDVDDAASLIMLENELSGEPTFAGAFPGAEAPATRAHLAARAAPLRAGSSR
jgi:rSAM/selenodomain-associated transferase 1